MADFLTQDSALKGEALTPSALITPEPLILFFLIAGLFFFFSSLLLHSSRMCVMRLGASVTTCHAAEEPVSECLAIEERNAAYLAEKRAAS